MNIIEGLSAPSFFEKNFQFSSFKEALLISAIALTAIATFVQALTGSFLSSALFGILWVATYFGYEAHEKVEKLELREKYYESLKTSLKTMNAQCETFRLENKKMSQNNVELELQVDLLKKQVQGMELLLEKLKGSAKITQELLNSCIDVSKDQKQTEKRVAMLLTALEGQVNRQESQLSETLQTMAQKMQHFFLHEAKGANLLKIKKEFAETASALQIVKTELERVQRELDETNKQLKITSQKIDQQIESFGKKYHEDHALLEKKRTYLEGVRNRIITLCQNPSIFSQLTNREQRTLTALHTNII